MHVYEQQAALLKLLAHPLRLQVVDVLRRGEECVCHLAAMLDKPQPYVSQQLAILRNGGVLVDHREGTNIFYHLASAHAARVVEAACGPVPAPEPDITGAERQAVHGCHCPKCVGDMPDRG